MAKAHEVEIAIETLQQAISMELDQVDSELKLTGEWLGSLDEMESTEGDVAYQMLLPLRIRQATLSQSTGMCKIAAEALKNKQTLEIMENIATQPRLARNGFFYPARQAMMILESQDHSILCLGHCTLAEFRQLAKQAEQGDRKPAD